MSSSAPIRAGERELWVERRGSGPDVLLIAGLGDPAEAWQPQLDGLADRYRVTAFDNRGAGRTPLPDEPLVGGDDGRRRRRDPARTRRADRPRRRLLDGQRHRAGARASPPRARPQPRAREHLRSPGRPLPLPARVLALAGRGGAERARLLRGVLHLGLHAARARRRHRGPARRGGAGLPPPAVRRGLPSAGRRLPRARHGRPPLADRRADARARRGARHHPAAALRPLRRRRRSRTHASSSCPARPTSPSRKSPTSSTPASTPSGATSTPSVCTPPFPLRPARPDRRPGHRQRRPDRDTSQTAAPNAERERS